MRLYGKAALYRQPSARELITGRAPGTGVETSEVAARDRHCTSVKVCGACQTPHCDALLQTQAYDAGPAVKAQAVMNLGSAQGMLTFHIVLDQPQTTLRAKPHPSLSAVPHAGIMAELSLNSISNR